CRAALCALGSVLGAALFAVGHADRIQSAAHHVVADAGEIFHTAAADEHNRVLLQVVADARNVGSDLDAVGQAHASHLAQGRVRLLRGLRVHAGAHTAPLRRGLQGRRCRLVSGRRTPLADELIKRWQTETPYSETLKIVAGAATHLGPVWRARNRSRAHMPQGWCFASDFVPLPDENWDGGRASIDNGSRLRFANSGPHSPPRWRNARTPMR